MKKIDLGYAIFSLAIPLLVYSALLFLLPANYSRAAVPLLASNAAGFILSVIVLARSDRHALETSSVTRMALLLAVIGLFANTIAFEYTLFFRPESF